MSKQPAETNSFNQGVVVFVTGCRHANMRPEGAWTVTNHVADQLHGFKH